MQQPKQEPAILYMQYNIYCFTHSHSSRIPIHSASSTLTQKQRALAVHDLIFKILYNSFAPAKPKALS